MQINLKPKIYIIIISWNNYNDTKKCLSSLNNIYYSNLGVIVVDNGSTDGSIQKIQKEFPDCGYILNQENLGYTKALNLAVKQALNFGAEYIFPLNNDAWIEDRNFFTKLVEFAETDKKIGIVAPQQKFPNGNLQLSAYQVFIPQILYFFLPKIFADFFSFGLSSDFNEIKEVLWANGMYLVKKETLKSVGSFDERFFVGGEDVDYCLRAHKLGWKVYYYPNISFFHIGGNSRKNFESVSIGYNKLTIESNALLIYKYRHRLIAHSYRYLLAAGLFLRAGEWFILSFSGKRKYKLELAKQFLNACFQTLKFIPKT